MEIRPAWIVAHVGVLVCEFHGIVSVEHFPASIGTHGIGSLGARIEIPFVLVFVSRPPALSRVRLASTPRLFRLWAIPPRNRPVGL